MSYVIIPIYIERDDPRVAHFAHDNSLLEGEAYRSLNCLEHYRATGELLDWKKVCVGEPIKVRPTVKRVIKSREGLDSNGSDYWLHKDVMDED